MPVRAAGCPPVDCTCCAPPMNTPTTSTRSLSTWWSGSSSQRWPSPTQTSIARASLAGPRSTPSCRISPSRGLRREGLGAAFTTLLVPAEAEGSVSCLDLPMAWSWRVTCRSATGRIPGPGSCGANPVGEFTFAERFGSGLVSRRGSPASPPAGLGPAACIRTESMARKTRTGKRCSDPIRQAGALSATTELDQSMTEVGRTTCLLIPSSLGSSPSARPTSWGRHRQTQLTAGGLARRRVVAGRG